MTRLLYLLFTTPAYSLVQLLAAVFVMVYVAPAAIDWTVRRLSC